MLGMINDSEMTLYCVDIILFGMQFGAADV